MGTGGYSMASSLIMLPVYFLQDSLTCKFSFNSQIFHLILHKPSLKHVPIFKSGPQRQIEISDLRHVIHFKQQGQHV